MILDQTDINAKALLANNPSCEFTVGATYESLRWKSEDITKPTKEEFNEIVSTWEKTFSDNQYKRDREREYPSIQDQLDEIYHNGINSWKAVIKVTKDKYPKG